MGRTSFQRDMFWRRLARLRRGERCFLYPKLGCPPSNDGLDDDGERRCGNSATPRPAPHPALVVGEGRRPEPGRR